MAPGRMLATMHTPTPSLNRGKECFIQDLRLFYCCFLESSKRSLRWHVRGKSPRTKLNAQANCLKALFLFLIHHWVGRLRFVQSFALVQPSRWSAHLRRRDFLNPASQIQMAVVE